MDRYLTVLVVEDSITTAKFVSIILAEDGRIDPIIAHTLAEGIAVIKSRSIDAVVLDLHLPDASNTEAIAAIAAAAPNVPIVVFTGSYGEEMRAPAILAGADAFLEKPLAHVSHLVGAIRDSILDREAALKKIEAYHAEYAESRVGTDEAITCADEKCAAADRTLAAAKMIEQIAEKKIPDAH